MITFFQLKDQNELLSDEVFRKAPALLPGNRESRKLLAKVDSLVEQIKAFAIEVDSFETFRWLHRIAGQWRDVYSLVFNSPRRIELPTPKQALLAPPSPRFSDEEIQFFLKRSTRFLDWGKKLHALDSNRETWPIAEVLFCLDVLQGRINFPKRISPNSYHYLDGQWLSEVKLMRAYFIWQERGNGFVSEAMSEQHYLDACSELRGHLVDTGIKAVCREFEDPMEYIETYLLEENGKIDAHRDGKGRDLVAAKACRIWLRTRRDDEKRNWHEALTFTRLFYENIIGAVVDRDVEKTLMVLKALQFSREDLHTGLYVISCFEAALAIYFLDPEIVEGLWKSSEEKPRDECIGEYSIDVAQWPTGFTVPQELADRLYVEPNQLRFSGVMTHRERDLLCRALDDEDDRQVIEDLYVRSRLIHRDSTL